MEDIPKCVAIWRRLISEIALWALLSYGAAVLRRLGVETGRMRGAIDCDYPLSQADHLYLVRL